MLDVNEDQYISAWILIVVKKIMKEQWMNEVGKPNISVPFIKEKSILILFFIII